ncbi:aromatic acid/H+ symport family MFS transporter [Heyndrickxia oleronia]|uniref:MFS transporter n=1 Tax=Heyndrickxia oleronia TaxID=38875 RepID=UPI0020402939|nr:aromatic acid/H+ symport family MFS transporter [Heyndrickxia oleronia]MCM3238602.1 aromatic acid/H+ symport family MFS transporter [Heyndrickxia oleronia]
MRSINASEVMARSKFNRFHLTVFFGCAFGIIFDGYDLNMYGVVLPALMKEWSLTAIEAGLIGSYALLGMMAGAFLFAPLADKLGRKKVLVICISLFSVATILTGFVTGPTQFSILRLIAGIGLGGLMPNVIALMTEYSPKSIRGILVATMYCGYAIGGILVSLMGIFVLPDFGWRVLFWSAGVPLLFLPLFIKYFPESMSFYILRKQNAKLCDILNRVDPGQNYSENDEFQFEEEKERAKGFPVKKLFESKRARSTFMFWLACFSCLIMVYGLNTWLPKLMMQAGYPLGSSLSFMLALNIGSIIGSILGGWLADRIGSKKVLVMFFILGAACFALLGLKTNLLFLYTLIIVGGACTIGTQNIANPYIAEYYPKEMRSTGIGWALGMGRIGALLAPTLGGILLSKDLPLQINFLAFCIPCILGGLVILLIQNKYGSFDKKVIENKHSIEETIFEMEGKA